MKSKNRKFQRVRQFKKGSCNSLAPNRHKGVGLNLDHCLPG